MQIYKIALYLIMANTHLPSSWPQPAQPEISQRHIHKDCGIYTHAYTCMHVYICIYTYIHKYAYTHIRTHTYKRTQQILPPKFAMYACVGRMHTCKVMGTLTRCGCTPGPRNDGRMTMGARKTNGGKCRLLSYVHTY